MVTCSCAWCAPSLCSLSVERCPDNRMLGRREIVDGKVDICGPLPPGSHAYVLVITVLCVLLFRWIHWRLRLFASGWRVHVADVQAGIRHRDQGRRCDPELRRRQGTDDCLDYCCSVIFHTEELGQYLVRSIILCWADGLLTWPMSDCLKGGRCGIYGANSPEWVISMQVRLLYQSFSILRRLTDIESTCRFVYYCFTRCLA